MIWVFFDKTILYGCNNNFEKSKSFGYFVDHQAFVCLKKKDKSIYVIVIKKKI